MSRIDNKSVDAVDVAAFGREYVGKGRMQPLAAARSHNLFNRVSLDECVGRGWVGAWVHTAVR